MDLRRQTLEGLDPESRLEAAHRLGSAALRPRAAARCSPAFRNNTSSRCSSSRCCTRNSSSRSCTTATAAPPTLEDIQAASLGHRGTLIHRTRSVQAAMWGTSRVIQKRRCPGSEGPLLLHRPANSLLHLHPDLSPTSHRRVLRHQSPLQ